MCCSATFATRAMAQRQTGKTPATYVVTGTVVDREGNTLADAEVAVVDGDTIRRITHTDEKGSFSFAELTSDVARLRFRRLGFVPQTVATHITADNHAATLFVTLESSAALLRGVRIEDVGNDSISPRLRAFYAREQQNHFGHFIDPDRIQLMNPHLTSEALRGVPGVVVRPLRSETLRSISIGNAVTIRGCRPLVWVDGAKVPGAEVDDVARPGDVLAIEVYNSLTGLPPEYFDSRATCGTVLVWLKDR
jgi:hypothetical protein